MLLEPKVEEEEEEEDFIEVTYPHIHQYAAPLCYLIFKRL
jgi:hypothetical protein